MSNRRKFNKLALPCTSRQISTQISEFFIQDKELSSAETIEQIPATKRKIVENDDIILQNEDVAENGTTSDSNTEETLKLIKSFEYDKQSTKRVRPNTRSSTQCNTISHFFNQSDNEFEIPRKQPKQVKKVQPKKATSKFTKVSKKQMKIKKAFMRSEEALFSEIVAQHSIADNVDPDELQLALTLSRSEQEVASSSCPIADEYSFPDYAHHQSSGLEKVRTKLQEFGFHVGGHKDYDISSFVRGNKKGKWASKLTPLTLRNAEKQKEKLEKKIQKLLNIQDFGNESQDMEIKHCFQLSSTFLSTIKSPNNTSIVKSKAELLCKEETDISDFYVSMLFKPSSTEPCALLKRFEDIPGRDFSPSRKIENKIPKRELLEKGQIKLTDNRLKEQQSLSENVQSSSSKPPLLNTSSNIDNVPISDFSAENNSIQRNVDEQQAICLFELSTEVPKSKEMENLCHFEVGGKNYIRAPSPDLFADCEADSFETSGTKSSFTEANNAVITSNTTLNGKEKSGLRNNESNEECIEEMHLVANGSGIESFERDTTDQDSSNNNTKDHHENNLCVDLTQEDSDNEILEKYVKSSFSDKQLSENSSSSDCIILSDDEVNYSIKMAADIEDKSMIEDKADSVDLTRSSSSDHEKENSINNKMHEKYCSISEDEMYLTKQTSFSNKIQNHNNMDENRNTSLAELIKDNYNLESSQSEDEVDLSGTLSENENLKKLNATSTHFDVTSCYDLHSLTKKIKKYNKMELEYNNIPTTSFIDLNKDTDDIDNDLISNNDDDDQFPISLEKLPAARLDFNWVEPKPSGFNTNFNDSDFDLAKLKAKYGIRDDVRKPSTVPNSKSSKNFRKSISENIHTHTTATSKVNLKKYSSSNKFSEFLDEDICYSDVDEFDKLISKSPISTRMKHVKNPSDLETLLKGNITYKAKETMESPEEYVFNGKKYLIRTDNVPPKPDYTNMDTPTRLRELHLLGLKPLKKKQAIIMLDYIYHQTHPIISNDQNSKALRRASKNNMELQDDLSSDDNNLNERTHLCKYNKFNLKDCFGDRLLASDDELGPESKNEIFIFQTNRKSKISNCLLPLHLAWFNLIKSNEKLREAILYYEPIDLQEIYIFLKKIGYRYDPKDIKKFLDQRCIIFRYDLSDGNSNRHARKIKSLVKKY